MVQEKITETKLYECIFKEIIYHANCGNCPTNANDLIAYLFSYLCLGCIYSIISRRYSIK